MKKALLALVVVCGLFGLGASAQANDWGHGGGHASRHGYSQQPAYGGAHGYGNLWRSQAHQGHSNHTGHGHRHNAPYQGHYALRPSYGHAPGGYGHGGGHGQGGHGQGGHHGGSRISVSLGW